MHRRDLRLRDPRGPQPGESGQAAGLSDHKERMGGEPSSYAEVQMGRIPIGRADRALRSTLKRAIGFRDASRNPAKPEPVDPVEPA